MSQLTLTGAGSSGSSSAFVPTSIPNLVLWLNAAAGITLNGSDVSAWADQSGNSNHVIQGTALRQPLYDATGGPNSLPILHFTKAENHLLRSATAILSGVAGFTYFVVCRRPNTTINTIIISAENAAITDQVVNDLAYCFNGESDFANHSTSDTDWMLRKQVFDGSLSGNANRLKSYENSVQKTLSFTGTIAATTQSSTFFLIGNYYLDLEIWDFDGDIAEILAFDRTLSAGEQAQVDNYLTSKFSIV